MSGPGWELHVPPPPDGSSGVTFVPADEGLDLPADPPIAPVVSGWQVGDELILTAGRWARRLRVVGVTDTGPCTREYRLREIDHGNHVLQPEADEEVLDEGRLVGSYTVELGRQQGHEDAEVDDEDRQQVGEDHGSRWQQEHRPDFTRPGGQGRRAQADVEGLYGSERAGRVRHEQAGFPQGPVVPRPEGPVLAPGWETHLADGAWG